MIRNLLTITLSCLPLALVSCKHSDAAEKLPPPTGSGAPALPTLPTLANSSAEEALEDNQPLRATGTTMALHQAELGPKSSGVLAAVLVDEGDKVKKGQPLFRLEANMAALATKQAQVGLEQARVGFSQAELDYHRAKSLFEQGAVSRAVWDQARIGYERAKVAVQQAEVALSTARTALGDTTVVAPFAGVVTAKRKNTGETVTMMPPTVVLVIQDLSKIEVRTKLAENALNRINPGQPMKVRFPSLGEERDVPIDRINPSVDPVNRTLEIVGVIPNEDRKLKAGMLVEVTFPPPPVSNDPATTHPPPSPSNQAPAPGIPAVAHQAPSKNPTATPAPKQ